MHSYTYSDKQPAHNCQFVVIWEDSEGELYCDEYKRVGGKLYAYNDQAVGASDCWEEVSPLYWQDARPVHYIVKTHQPHSGTITGSGGI